MTLATSTHMIKNFSCQHVQSSTVPQPAMTVRVAKGEDTLPSDAGQEHRFTATYDSG